MRTLYEGETGNDVELLQQALFEKHYHVDINQTFDAVTKAAVIAFQNAAGLKPDGIVGPVTQTALGMLGEAGVADPVTGLSEQMAARMCIGAPRKNIATHLPNIIASLKKYGLTAPAMALMAIATIHVESAGFAPIAEGKSHFNSPDGGPPFGKYEAPGNKLGNKFPGDGYKFRGRGFVQLTGRAHYRHYGQLLTPKIDLESDPDRALDSAVAADLLALYLKENEGRMQLILANGALSPSDKLEGLRRVVNGGINGLDEFVKSWKIGTDAMGLTLDESLTAPAVADARPQAAWVR